MRPINLLGKKIIIKIEDNKEDNKGIWKFSLENTVNLRIILMLFLICLSVLSSKLSYVKNIYKKGTVIEKDIIAPRSISYIDEDKKRNLVDKIISDVDDVYVRDKSIELITYDKINSFFEDLKKASLEQSSYSEYLKRLELNLSEDELKRILEPEDIEIVKKETIKKVEELYKEGVKDDTLSINNALNNVKLTGDNLEFLIIQRFLKPNTIYNGEKTETLLKEKIADVEDIRINISAGDIVLKAGTKLTDSDIQLLKRIGVYSLVDNVKVFTGNILYVLVVSGLLWITLKKIFISQMMNKRHYYATLFAIIILISGIRLINIKFVNIFPFEYLVILLGILFGSLYSGIISSFVFMYSIPIIGFNNSLLMVLIVSMIFALYSSSKIKTRADIVNIGIYVGLLKMLLGVATSWVNKLEFVDTIFSMAQLFLSGILSGMLVIALLPYFEASFNILTKMKLIELGDLSHPLLKKMSIEAPGTFQHSMLVATLSEQAAEAIGADSIFTRVACYYHDIGKMKRPNFYVENQRGGINPHDKLSPSMSALIIRAHTKDGQEMGKEYNIPREIRDIMAEHQGTTFLAYFYNKAKREDPSVEASDFRYDGPKPRTKESAVIMLADTIEAAVRTLENKDPISIEKMIRKLIDAKVDDEQLSDADLTLKELEIIIKTFVKVFGGIYHTRIKYPDQKK
ncbi:MAG: HDIG domain-containing protein [Fusobacteriaceae bacterium]|nr:HDIG domain-containing protein [Fusobacteriaceae bacterium]